MFYGNRNKPFDFSANLNLIISCSFEYKPSGMISYTLGTRGGMAACVSARPFLSEIGCLPVKHQTTVSQVVIIMLKNMYCHSKFKEFSQ